jgi:hypothetical protein
VYLDEVRRIRIEDLVRKARHEGWKIGHNIEVDGRTFETCLTKAGYGNRLAFVCCSRPTRTLFVRVCGRIGCRRCLHLKAASANLGHGQLAKVARKLIQLHKMETYLSSRSVRQTKRLRLQDRCATLLSQLPSLLEECL